MSTRDRVLAVALLLLAVWVALSLVRARPTRLDVAVALLLATGSVVWLFGAHRYEGPTLLRLTAGHGLTVTDLGVPPDLFLASAVVVRRWRSRG